MSIPIPAQMRHLKIDPIKGLPVPWFVPWVDGKPEWRAADGDKRSMAIALGNCWVCGYKVRPTDPRWSFILGPMCGLNRISAEPPSHRDCALYSLRACPFLTRPRMERRRGPGEEDLGVNVAGVMIARNPGAMALWETATFRPVDDGEGGVLLRVGEPLSVSWWAEGRAATRAEVLVSIVTGIPHLMAAGIDPEGWEELARSWVDLDRWLPVAE